MTLQSLTKPFLKGGRLFQLLLLIITVVTLASCEDDAQQQFYFDAEKQKEVDELVIRKYFRDNGVDTTAVQRTESGLYYLHVTEGEGPQIELNDTVEVHYIGRFTYNLKFDSSYERGRTSFFVVRESQIVNGVGIEGVIKGWVEGLQKMRVGGEIYLYIPSHLAYGPFQKGNIPPNSVLVFNMEVFSKR